MGFYYNLLNALRYHHHHQPLFLTLNSVYRSHPYTSIIHSLALLNIHSECRLRKLCHSVTSPLAPSPEW